jgi:zinc transport system substrate-binding protein
MIIRKTAIYICLCFIFLLVSSCSDSGNPRDAGTSKIRVVASLYPVYDFAKNVGGKRIDVTLLLPPGEEPHSFDPRPADILDLNRADLFIYTNVYMEPWVNDIKKAIDNKKVVMLDASKGIAFIEGKAGGHDDHEGHTDEMDPHVWLDFDNAAKMVDNIKDALAIKDPAGRDYYEKNSDKYKASLAKLDSKFRKTLDGCKQKIFINGGHFAFGYLAKRYGLTYLSVYGFSPDAEPAPGQIVKITALLKKHKLEYIFHEELLMPRLAQTIAGETGAQLLFLHGAHNITKEDFEKGTSFLGIMEKNLENLEKGLGCRRK